VARTIAPIRLDLDGFAAFRSQIRFTNRCRRLRAVRRYPTALGRVSLVSGADCRTPAKPTSVAADTSALATMEFGLHPRGSVLSWICPSSAPPARSPDTL